MPFPALIDAEGHYLIEKHTISTAPSLHILGLTHQLRHKGADASRKALIVGNPNPMPSLPSLSSKSQEFLNPLPGAENEVLAIAKILGAEPIVGDSATETAVAAQMPQAQIIHLATHGLLEYGIPALSYLRDVPGAIALAPGGEEDGLLTAAEIYELDLMAELVVLSACDTGRGSITGDGVVGLSRAFIQAGVPSIIVSLWSVPDAPTAELMTEFYQQWQTTGNKAQALRQAMLTTMATHPNPRDWAAFTLIGEIDTPRE